MRYYYLWYSTAAIIAQAGGLSAWEGDIVMTAFTAFSSLLCMMGFAARLSDDRIQARRAAYWILALSLAGSAFPALYVVFGHEAVRSLFAREHGLETWIFQASWVPQHLASGSAVLIGLALLFEARPASKLSFRRSLPAGLMIAAGFGMSTWVGGLTFAICATSILVYKAASTGAGDHHRLAWQWGSAAAVAIVFASPFIYNQLPFLDLRGGHTAVVGLHPYPVLADTHVSDPLNLAAFWLLLLPAYMPALFIPSVICQWRYFSSRPVAGQSVLFLSILMYSSLAVSWLLRSQLANNDLGWRAVIIAVLAMTVLAALELSRNNASPAKYVCVGLLAIALLDGSRFALMNAKGNGKWMKDPIPDSAWQSIQRHTTTKDRILSNPHGYSAIESFGVNVMWTLKSNRNSCFQSADFVRAYQRTWSFDEIRAIDAELQLFFDGKIAASKISPLLSKLECTKVLIVEADRIWQSKQLLKSANLEPVSSGAGWKLLAPSTPSAGSIAD